MHLPPPDSQELADIIRRLEDTGDYRVLRRLDPGQIPTATKVRGPKIGVVVDVETTGLDSSLDEIIEVGMVAFEFSEDGKISRILRTFEKFREPSFSIPERITELTGISNEMVKGHDIEEAELAEFIADAAIIIAHNAAFDRKFLEKLAPCFENKAWACSATEIEWLREGYEGAKLAYLLNAAGVFHTGHRASEDCHALLYVISRDLRRSGVPGLQKLLESARQQFWRVWAEDAPFESKDALRSRGYRWNDGSNGRPRAWWKDIPRDSFKSEMSFLEGVVYRGKPRLIYEKVNAFNRYSSRL